MTRLQIEKLLENAVAEALGLRREVTSHRRTPRGRTAGVRRTKSTPPKVQRRA